LEALDLEARWLDNIAADTADETLASKIVRNKPNELVDACWTPTVRPVKLAEPQTYDGDGLCNRLYPAYSSPRIVAGGPLSADIIKCQLKPVEFNEYKVVFNSEQQVRLRRVFSDGVCDWSKPGVGQVPLMGTWLRFGPPAVPESSN
jgi:hypothetical protein